MLVNDLIHGLYPEAVAIGEDVSPCIFVPSPFFLHIVTNIIEYWFLVGANVYLTVHNIHKVIGG